MKKISAFILVIALSIGSLVFAQKVELKWTEKMLYDNKLDGFFDAMIGSNSKYIYAKFSNLSLSSKKTNNNMSLLAFDKKTMKKVKEVEVISADENNNKNSKYKDLYYLKTIVFEDLIYVFFKKWDKSAKDGREALYVQTYNGNLKKLNRLKKIYETKGDLFVVANEKIDNRILLGSEPIVQKGQSIRFEYKILNSDFSFESADQIKLPLKQIAKKKRGLSSSYELGDDGNIYVETNINLSKEERKAAKKGEPLSYSLLTIVTPGTKQVKSYSVKFDNKVVYDFDYIVHEKGVKLFGFFCDLQKDPKGNDLHGIFSTLIDSKRMALESVNFSYFTKNQLDILFAEDRKDRGDKRRIQSKRKKESEEESIASNYVIEQVISLDKSNIVLLCSRMNNYSKRVCSTNSKGQTTCKTYYYCQKSNVTAFKVDKGGDILWASNLDREITYNRWWVYDIRAIHKGNKIYVTYGSAYAAKAKKKNRSSKKSKEHRTGMFEYAVFDYNTGQYKRDEYRINPINAKKKDRKTIAPTRIAVIDNEFFVHSSRISYKPEAFLWCIPSLVCPLLLYIPFMNSKYKKGYGYMGSIKPL